MSGRVRHTLSTGRVTTGYRKTEVERSERISSDKLPEWTLRIELTPAYGFALPVGPMPGFIGVTIDARGTVTVSGRNKGWVERQAEQLCRKIAPYGFVRPVVAIMTRPEMERDDGKPPIRAEHRSGVIQWDGRDAPALVLGTAMRGLGSAELPPDAASRYRRNRPDGSGWL